MQTLPNEEKLINSNEEKIILTNHRIQMMDKVWGQSYTISIFLEDISSIEIKYTSKILLLFLCAMSILAGCYLGMHDNDGEGALGGLAFGAIFFVVWLFTRNHIISITSNSGTSLNFMVQGMGEENINDFVYRVSLAKQTRVNQLARI